MTGGAPEQKKQKRQSKEFQRTDLTGSKLSRWTERTRETLANTIDAVAGKIRDIGQLELLDSGRTVKGTLTDIGKKKIQELEDRLEQIGVENKLKQAQTETEFCKQQLLMAQAHKEMAQARGQDLDNIDREVQIRMRIAEITGGRTDFQLVWREGRPILVVGNVEAVERLPSKRLEHQDPPEVEEI